MSNDNHCASCGIEIPAELEICEKCKKRKIIIHKTLPRMLLILFIVTPIIYAFLVNNGYIAKTENLSNKAEVVFNSSWDGYVYQVKSWLKQNLKDPKSIKYINWSDVYNESNGGFSVRVKYRSKNSFGGYVVENKVFYLDRNGNVTYHSDY